MEPAELSTSVTNTCVISKKRASWCSEDATRGRCTLCRHGMNEEVLKLGTFIVDSEGSRGTIIPVGRAPRSSISVSAFGTCQLLESTNELLDKQLCNGLVLFARFQEEDSRARRFICIEKLDVGLFSLQPVPSTLISSCVTQDLMIVHETVIDPKVVEFESDDWWHPFQVHSPVTRADGASISLDLGPQPAQLVENVLDRVTMEELSQSLGTIYLETLYTSKASLVFFAKSTLSKLCRKLADHGFSPFHFSTYLQAKLVPNLTSLDWKYKNLIPSIIKSVVAGSPILNTSEIGIFESSNAEEVRFVRTWTDSCAQSLGGAITPDLILSSFLGQLKIREYQLIVLVLLECLALCVTDSRPSDTDAHAIQLLPANQQPPDILIDVLLDRLSILQSLDFTEQHDALRNFCVEVICPFYSSKLPELTKTLLRKCVPQDLLSFDVEPRLREVAKSGRVGSKDTSSRSSRSASLKRVRSAPANLLSEKKVVPKKRHLGREVSMTKRAPSMELKQQKVMAPKRMISFEERRRQRIEKEEQERVQVGRTPVKPRGQDVQQILQPGFVPQLSIRETSKASFMAISETPSKGHGSCPEGIAETPAASKQTPLHKIGRTTEAPIHGIQDTPSGKGILFKLDSPSANFSTRPSERRHRHMGASLLSSPTSASFPKLPSLKKSVTFSGAESRNRLLNPFKDNGEGSGDEDILKASGHNRLFGHEIHARRKSQHDLSSNDHEQEEKSPSEDHDHPSTGLQKSQTLEDVLDWL